MTKITVEPAYGRDYRSKEAVLKDWEQNKDFKISSPGIPGKYLNKEDAKTQNIKEVWIRYDRKKSVILVRV